MKNDNSDGGTIVPIALFPNSAAQVMNAQEAELRARLHRVMLEHRDLDVAIEALKNLPGSDLLQLQRMKKRKLLLRDEMQQVNDLLLPDIIA